MTGTPEAPGQFGLWGKEAKRDWPLITQDEAQQALYAFGLTCDEAIEWHSARPFSAVSRLRDVSGTIWFLKRHHRALRDATALREEHRFITHLARHGLAVAPPRITSSGDTTYSLQGGDGATWCYECFPALAGQDLYRDRMSWEPYLTVDQAFEAGSALARFHRAAQGYSAPSRAQRPLVSALTPLCGPAGPASGLRAWIASMPDLERALTDLGGNRALIEALTPHFKRAASSLSAPALQWGHGDWHGSNLIWHKTPPPEGGVAENAGKTCFAGVPFDFSMADLTTRAFDIAIALERSMIAWLTPCHEGDGVPDYRVEMSQISAFLRGYHAQWPLTASDRSDIAVFLPLAHATFACSEIWYYASLLRAPALARVTHDTYLVAHARWFSTAQGRALLDFIASPAGQGIVR
ncbi:phosphotransferase enzyme family protein [Asaia krungthepensis]|uniref:Aminoglycoside phosphotransferase n=1 Tax=Asaia krungthepensis NRIC 0535 TaxID=1307925 RepID=A0ABQ0PXI9_9PROT|nr:phosphotransferase [Asaia krungthepensis]GBQ84069.1 aminoglycoside phosphotransferase [Asaia krungthepensis NRIC 0535]